MIGVMVQGAHGGVTIEAAGEGLRRRAVRVLFLGGFDTLAIAALLGIGEPDVVALLHADPPVALNGVA